MPNKLNEHYTYRIVLEVNACAVATETSLHASNGELHRMGRRTEVWVSDTREKKARGFGKMEAEG